MDERLVVDPSLRDMRGIGTTSQTKLEIGFGSMGMTVESVII